MKIPLCLALLVTIYGTVSSFSITQQAPKRNADEVKGVSFDDLVQDFAEKKAKAAGTTVAWWDAHAQHPMVEDTPEHQITVSTSPFRYLVTTKIEEKDTVTGTTTHANPGDEVQDLDIMHSASYRSSYKWKPNKTLHIGAFLSTEATLPPALGGSISVTKISLDMGQTNINSNNNRKEPFLLSIPSKSVLDVDWVATDRYLESIWEVTVDINGYVAVYFDDTVNGKNLNFYSVKEMANDDFKATDDGVAFMVTGTFEGSRTINFYPRPHPARPLEVIEPGNE